ncbi:RRP1 protein [Fasciolopsis buskii]|uniref:RRP1 protein n=1 Tax=Fasciolopsis buskii TaxID=27845 RepID=A0A8E0RMZ8_9TREM|nr:RRP1 protein [Fasciolopsis buski]
MQDKLLLKVSFFIVCNIENSKEEVVTRICGILQRIQNRTVLINYSSAIFETLAREWDRLDNWRVDKFMLLTRDFFTTGLQLLPQMGEEMWDQFLSVIFEKVLNKDMQHAIGLKMHTCTVLGEELSKRVRTFYDVIMSFQKIKSFCIVMTLMHLVERIKELPRHHSYGHTLLRLIHTLIRILRRHANVNILFIHSQFYFIALPRCIDRSCHKVFDSTRRLSEVIQTNGKHIPLSDSSGTHSCADVALHAEASKSDSLTVQNNVGIEDRPKLENIHPASVSAVDEPNPSESPDNTFEQVFPLTSEEKTTTITTPDTPKDALHCVLETPSSKQRRVSFGKVFRKSMW